MSQAIRPTIAPGFLNSLAWVAIAGTLALLGGNVVGSIVVPNHDWIADTVSDLAAGRYEIIQDVALYGYAATLIALALGSAHLHDGSGRWGILAWVLTLLALCVVIIGARNEYGDSDNEGIVIHIYVVYTLGLLFAACFALMALEAARFNAALRNLSWGCCALWCVAAPIFFVMPTGYDGLWERGLGLISIVWCIGYALALRQVAQAAGTGPA